MGLERTGTTFLQRNVFPFFDNVYYIPKRKYSLAPQLIRESTSNKILVSREFNRGFTEAINQFSHDVKATVIPIIILRRHDQWVLSLYKRELKNGQIITFKSFIDHYLNEDALRFHEKCIHLIETFGQVHLLFYDHLKNDPVEFLEEIQSILDCPVKWEKVNFNSIHSSYTTHQLKFIYLIGSKISPILIQYKIPRYFLLYLAILLPGYWLDGIKIYSNLELDNIRKQTEADWQKCLSLSKMIVEK